MKYIDTQNLTQFSIKAADGDIGHITDFYFDENLFHLRYLVVDTEKFLKNKQVLVSPISFKKIDKEKKTISIFLTKKELEDLPSYKSVDIVSRQYEKAYYDHFTWPYYWRMHSTGWTIAPYSINAKDYPKKVRNYNGVINKSKLLEDDKKSSLRSSKEVSTYKIEGIDEKFGQIQGYILNPENLAIEFFIINTMSYLPSTNVLLRPEWIEEISWNSKTVRFPFTKKLIKSAPPYKKEKLDQEQITNSDIHFQSALDENSKEQKKVFNLKKNRNILKNFSKKQIVVGHIPSGLFVVTVQNQETKEYEGFLASWVQQASFEPLMVSLCIKDGRPGIKTVLNKSPFCINIVGKDRTEYLSHLKKINKNGENPLKKIPHKKVAGKGVFIDGAKSVIICKAKEISHPGDHYLITAEVIEGVILNSNTSSETYLRNEGSHY
jgi:flavin reductase (DIM6/NTAB) family NADH-FMN oxidoreductase RutF